MDEVDDIHIFGFERKFERHQDLLQSFTDAETLDDAFKWMAKIDKFEHKHFRLRPEYCVVGELLNRLKVATEIKDKFVLQNKLNRALRLVRWKEAYDPDNPANYGVIQGEQLDAAAAVDAKEEAELEKEKLIGDPPRDDSDDRGGSDSVRSGCNDEPRCACEQNRSLHLSDVIRRASRPSTRRLHSAWARRTWWLGAARG
ncbi:uncharacterized protein LOC109793606 [Cajanus cajan]|uniref:uncharacterized protein LOC109793606 n=1 Tax=Cajanus cajan TaxID=3821 RepID=UPI00098DB172|nr:uncharacterized protein LOC109793606 [Cajanus cajan]